MPSTLTDNSPQLDAPAPIFNCAECSHWLPPGSLACPECHAIVYSQYLRQIAAVAASQENAGQWAPARETWQKALEWLPVGTTQYGAVTQRIEFITGQINGQAANKAKWTRRLGPLAPVLFFLSKIKTGLFLLLKLKFLFSFLAFFAVYWALFGVWFGLGFTTSILVHEMGHFIAARRRGLRVDLPVFLPGLGAYVRWYSQGVSLDDLSSIALAGPFAGLLGAIGFGIASYSTPAGHWRDLFSALAHVSAWLNLINLIPILGLDGAQATYALSKLQRWLILATALIFVGWLHEWSYLFIAGGMGWRLWQGGYPEESNTRTFVRYVLLLFVLGLVVYRFPDTTQRF